MAQLVRPSDPESRDHVFVKGLIVGFSGAGKTTTMAKAPAPLIIEPSPQAMASIQAANADAHVLLVENVQDLRNLISALRKAKPSTIGDLPALDVTIEGTTITIQSIIVDDLEEIMDFFKSDVQSPGSDTMTQQQWGFVLDRSMSFLRALRNIPANFFVAVKALRVDDNSSQVLELALIGKKFKPALPGLFNCMAYLYRREPTEDDQRRYVAGFQLPDKYPTKGHPALGAVEDPDPRIWWAKIRDWQNKLISPEAPSRKQLPSDAPDDMASNKRKPKKSKPQGELKEEQVIDEALATKYLDTIQSVSDPAKLEQIAELVASSKEQGHLAGSLLNVVESALSAKQDVLKDAASSKASESKPPKKRKSTKKKAGSKKAPESASNEQKDETPEQVPTDEGSSQTAPESSSNSEAQPNNEAQEEAQPQTQANDPEPETAQAETTDAPAKTKRRRRKMG